MATKRITDLQLRSSFVATCNVPVDDTIQSYRVTGTQIYDYINTELNSLEVGADANTTMTIASLRNQVITPTATRTYKLPTTTVKKGDRWTFYNQATLASGFLVNVQSSGANAIASVLGSYRLAFVALQDTPTTAAHWLVLGNVEASTTSFGLLKKPNGMIRSDTGNAVSFGSTDTKIRRFNSHTVTGTAITQVTTAANGTVYTIVEDGVYSMSYTDIANGAGIYLGISLNSVNLTTNIQTLSAAERLIMNRSVTSEPGHCSVTANLSAGSLIRPHGNGIADNTSNQCQFVITQVARN